MRDLEAAHQSMSIALKGAMNIHIYVCIYIHVGVCEFEMLNQKEAETQRIVSGLQPGEICLRRRSRTASWALAECQLVEIKRVNNDATCVVQVQLLHEQPKCLGVGKETRSWKINKRTSSFHAMDLARNRTTFGVSADR